MRAIILTFCGVLLGSKSTIISPKNNYSAYNIPPSCELNERRPNLLDPHTFFWCLIDGPVLMKCVTGTYFNVTAGRCTEELKVTFIEEKKASVNETKEEPRCEQQKSAPKGVKCPAVDPLEYSVYFPDHSNCKCFYQCDNGIAKRMPCRKGLHFNATSSRCDWPWEAGCQTSGGVFGANEDEIKLYYEI